MKKFAFLLLLLTVALGLGTIFLYTDTFLLKEIDIESGWIPKEEILESASLHLGQNLFFLNRIDLTKMIKADHRVEEVKFKKVYPKKLLLRIKPRAPYVQLDQGKHLLLLDTNKNFIAVDAQITGLPLLKNFTVESSELGKIPLFKDELLFYNALDLTELCQQAEMKNIILWQENGMIFLYLDEGFKASFGKGNEIEKKFNNFYAIYQDLLDKNINRGTINLTNPQAPTFLPFD